MVLSNVSYLSLPRSREIVPESLSSSAVVFVKKSYNRVYFFYSDVALSVMLRLQLDHVSYLYCCRSDMVLRNRS